MNDDQNLQDSRPWFHKLALYDTYQSPPPLSVPISPFLPVCLGLFDADRQSNLLSFRWLRGIPRLEISDLTRIQLGM